MKAKILLLLVLFFPIFVHADNNLSEEYQLDLYKAEVIEIEDTYSINDSEIQVLKIEILNRDYEGYVTSINHSVLNNGYDFILNEGDKISVILDDNSFYYHNLDKSNYLLLLCIIFVIFVILIGGSKGLKALISLVLTILLILFGLVPLLLKGYNPIILSVITCVIATVLTFVITNGFTKKTLTAILGVSFGLLVGGLIAYIFGYLTRINGVTSDSAQMLQYLPGDITLNFKGLLFAGIIIGALGACMDVAMELTSSLTEIKRHNPDIKNNDLIKSGFNIGKDIMGTMVNTLVLAYTGGSLASILIFVGFNKSFNEIINLDSIASEIIRAISGSMGLLFAIPFTIFAFVFINKNKEINNEESI